MALTDKLTAIADAIRAKTGETGKMTLEQMPGKIGGISGGGGGGFDTSQMVSCFFTGKMSSIDFTGLDTSNFLATDDMFSGCEKITSLDLSSLDFSKVVSARRMFSYCPSLEMITVPPFPALEDAENFILSCPSLIVFRIGRDSDTEPQGCIFAYDNLSEDYPKGFQIQVPAHLVDAYKDDSSWADYADQIVARP